MFRRQEGLILRDTTRTHSFIDVTRIYWKVHKLLTLFVEVKANSYTTLIACDFRDVPNVL